MESREGDDWEKMPLSAITFTQPQENTNGTFG